MKRPSALALPFTVALLLCGCSGNAGTPNSEPTQEVTPVATSTDARGNSTSPAGLYLDVTAHPGTQQISMLQCWQTASPGEDATVYEPLEGTYTLELNGETRMFDTATDSWTPDEDLSESVLLNRDTDDKPTITSGGEADAIDWRTVKCTFESAGGETVWETTIDGEALGFK